MPCSSFISLKSDGSEDLGYVIRRVRTRTFWILPVAFSLCSSACASVLCFPCKRTAEPSLTPVAGARVMSHGFIIRHKIPEMSSIFGGSYPFHSGVAKWWYFNSIVWKIIWNHFKARNIFSSLNLIIWCYILYFEKPGQTPVSSLTCIQFQRHLQNAIDYFFFYIITKLRVYLLGFKPLNFDPFWSSDFPILVCRSFLKLGLESLDLVLLSLTASLLSGTQDVRCCISLPPQIWGPPLLREAWFYFMRNGSTRPPSWHQECSLLLVDPCF